MAGGVAGWRAGRGGGGWREGWWAGGHVWRCGVGVLGWVGAGRECVCVLVVAGVVGGVAGWKLVGGWWRGVGGGYDFLGACCEAGECVAVVGRVFL